MPDQSPFANLLGSVPSDPDLQAGSLGLSVPEIVSNYLSSPGQVLTILRTVKGVEVADVARATKIDSGRLAKYESWDLEPSPQDIVALSKFFGADLRLLMQALGTIRSDAAEESMGIAAQSGDELTAEERLDLRNLVGAFAGRSGKRKQ